MPQQHDQEQEQEYEREQDQEQDQRQEQEVENGQNEWLRKKERQQRNEIPETKTLSQQQQVRFNCARED